MADLGENLDNIEDGVEQLKNTKFKLFGLSMTPTTIGAAFALISSVIGALYGSFQVYNDYMEMKEQIQSYTAPDLSGLQQQISVLSEKVDSKLVQVESNVDVIKDSYRVELDNIKRDLDKAEDLIRTTEDSTARTQRELRNDVYGLEKRVNESLRQVDADVREVRKDLEEKIRTVLANPLNNVE